MIQIFDLTGTLVHEANTQRLAADFLEVSTASVSKALTGKTKHVKGHILGKDIVKDSTACRGTIVEQFGQYCINTGRPFIAGVLALVSTNTGEEVRYSFGIKALSKYLGIQASEVARLIATNEIVNGYRIIVKHNFIIEDFEVLT